MNKLLAFIVALSAFVLMSATTQAQQYLRHTVEWGETVYSIPVHYGITTKQFMAINNMSYDNIQLKPGQSVIIRELTAAELAQNKPAQKEEATTENTKVISVKEEMMKKIREDVEASNAKALEQAKAEQEKWEREKAALAKAEAETERLKLMAQQKEMELAQARQAAEKAKAAEAARAAQEKQEREKAEAARQQSATSTLAANESMGPNGIKYTISTNGYHVVQKQQTMYHLSKIYNIALEDLKKMNNMATTDLAIGQKLKVRN